MQVGGGEEAKFTTTAWGSAICGTHFREVERKMTHVHTRSCVLSRSSHRQDYRSMVVTAPIGPSHFRCIP